VTSVTITATDEDGGLTSASFDLTVNNVDPSLTVDTTAVAINEGSSTTKSITTSDVPADTVSVTASIGTITDNGNGSWTWSYDGADDLPVTSVTITATDEDGGLTSASFDLTVNNVDPTASANNYVTSQAVNVTGNVITDDTGSGVDTDPAGANDPLTISSHTDPSNGTLTIAASGSFTYTPDSTFAGVDSFRYTISDGDEGYSTATVTITVSAAAAGSVLTIDDTCLGGTALLITGTSGDDLISVVPGLSAATLNVTVNGTTTTVAKPSGRIIVTGEAGNDTIHLAGAIANQAWLYGDAGNDVINNGNGGGLLIGGDGDDQLTGGGGRDIMIGGQGADKLVGNGDDDILVAGYTTKDNRTAANHGAFWCDVVHEWNSGNLFRDRVSNLRGELLPEVFDDVFADDIDFLNGSGGDDWLIFSTGEDKVAGRVEASN
jgi:hypothetical protein